MAAADEALEVVKRAYHGFNRALAGEDFGPIFERDFDEVRLEIEDLRETSGAVVYRQRTEVTGGGSGIDIGDRSWAVARIRGGRLLSVVEDYSRDGALKRAGLG